VYNKTKISAQALEKLGYNSLHFKSSNLLTLSLSMAAPQVQGWIVPKIQSAVCSLPFIQSSPMIKGLLEHPAGPFTSEFPP